MTTASSPISTVAAFDIPVAGSVLDWTLLISPSVRLGGSV